MGDTITEIEDLCESQLGPVPLKTGINIEDLRKGEVEFEISPEAMEKEGEGFSGGDIYQYMSTEALGEEQEEGDEPLEGEPFQLLAKKMVKVTPDGGVKKMLLQQGTGGAVPNMAEVRYHYNAYLEYGDEPFDSTYMRGSPEKVCLDSEEEKAGIFEVIQGLTIALRTMKKSEQARFLVRPEYAYRERGAPPRIPGNATILYQVELVSVIESIPGEFRSMTLRERKEAPFSVILKEVEGQKMKGQDFFKQKRYDLAFRAYRQGCMLLEDARLADDNDEQIQQKRLLTLYINCALCSLKLCQPRRVLYYCNMARRIDNNNTKCHYCRGKALRQLGEFEDARKSLLRARELAPASKDIAKEFEELDKKMQQMQLVEKQLYRRMFGFSGTKSQQDQEEENELQISRDNRSIQQIDSKFREKMGHYLQEFLKDPVCLEMPFASSVFTPAELQCIAELARELDLEVEERGEGAKYHVKVLKKHPKQGQV